LEALFNKGKSMRKEKREGEGAKANAEAQKREK